MSLSRLKQGLVFLGLNSRTQKELVKVKTSSLGAVQLLIEEDLYPERQPRGPGWEGVI
jgi:hypothetical protein